MVPKESQIKNKEFYDSLKELGLEGSVTRMSGALVVELPLYVIANLLLLRLGSIYNQGASLFGELLIHDVTWNNIGAEDELVCLSVRFSTSMNLNINVRTLTESTPEIEKEYAEMKAKKYGRYYPPKIYYARVLSGMFTLSKTTVEGGKCYAMRKIGDNQHTKNLIPFISYTTLLDWEGCKLGAFRTILQLFNEQYGTFFKLIPNDINIDYEEKPRKLDYISKQEKELIDEMFTRRKFAIVNNFQEEETCSELEDWLKEQYPNNTGRDVDNADAIIYIKPVKKKDTIRFAFGKKGGKDEETRKETERGIRERQNKYTKDYQELFAKNKAVQGWTADATPRLKPDIDSEDCDQKVLDKYSKECTKWKYWLERQLFVKNCFIQNIIPDFIKQNADEFVAVYAKHIDKSSKYEYAWAYSNGEEDSYGYGTAEPNYKLKSIYIEDCGDDEYIKFELFEKNEIPNEIYYVRYNDRRYLLSDSDQFILPDSNSLAELFDDWGVTKNTPVKEAVWDEQSGLMSLKPEHLDIWELDRFGKRLSKLKEDLITKFEFWNITDVLDKDLKGLCQKTEYEAIAKKIASIRKKWKATKVPQLKNSGIWEMTIDEMVGLYAGRITQDKYFYVSGIKLDDISCKGGGLEKMLHSRYVNSYNASFDDFLKDIVYQLNQGFNRIESYSAHPTIFKILKELIRKQTAGASI